MNVLEGIFDCSLLHFTLKSNVWAKLAAGYSLSFNTMQHSDRGGSTDFERIIYSLDDSLMAVNGFSVI